MLAAMHDFVRLRFQTLARTPGFLPGEAVADRLRRTFERARGFGMVHEIVRANGGAVAQLMFFRDPEAWFAGPVVLGWIDRDGSDLTRDVGLDQVLAAVDRHRDRLGAETLLEIAVDDGPLLAGLLERGFGIDSVIQVGDVRQALTLLGSGPSLVELEPEVHLVPLTAVHVPGIIDLHRRVFSAEPQWCWFGAYPEHLARMAKDLVADLGGQYALLRGDVVVGHLGAERVDSPYWGRVGGLELVLEAPLRGRGLARPLYRVALESLIERGAVMIKGGTAQPGVMALGRVMQRPWHSFNLRRDPAFGPEHFLRFAPEDVRRAHLVSL